MSWSPSLRRLQISPSLMLDFRMMSWQLMVIWRTWLRVWRMAHSQSMWILSSCEKSIPKLSRCVRGSAGPDERSSKKPCTEEKFKQAISTAHTRGFLFPLRLDSDVLDRNFHQTLYQGLLIRRLLDVQEFATITDGSWIPSLNEMCMSGDYDPRRRASNQPTR